MYAYLSLIILYITNIIYTSKNNKSGEFWWAATNVQRTTYNWDNEKKLNKKNTYYINNILKLKLN